MIFAMIWIAAWIITAIGLAYGMICTNCVPRIEQPAPITYRCSRIIRTLVGYRCMRSTGRSVNIIGIP